MRVNVNYEGLTAEQVLKIAEVLANNEGDSRLGMEDVNTLFPGRASLVEDAEPEPSVQVAVFFTIPEGSDLDEILEYINATLIEIGLPGDAEYADLQIEDNEAE